MFTMVASLLIAVSSGASSSSFFRDPPMDMVTVAPDGAHIAYRAPHAGRPNLFVADLDGTNPRPVTSFADRQVDAYAWVDGENLVVMKSEARDERRHVYAVRIDGNRVLVDLNPPGAYWVAGQGVSGRRREAYLPFVTDEGASMVVRIAFPSLERTTLASSRYPTIDWKVAPDGKQVAWAVVMESKTVLFHQEGGAAPRPVASYPLAVNMEVIGFGADGRILLLSNSDADRRMVTAVDPMGVRPPENLHQCEGVDVWEARFDREGEVTEILCQDERPRHRVSDGSLRAVYGTVGALLDGAVIDIASFDDARRSFVVNELSDRRPPRIHLYDATTGRLTRLGQDLPLDDTGGEMRPVSFRARDGMAIPAYLTLPSSLPPPHGYPAIVLAHGGPLWRVVWGYDPAVRFLVSRGYAVFQPNFRGSSGYGAAFDRAGWRRWGTLSQDDIADGARWLAGREDIDAGRMAVVGQSFGGYSAQMQLVRYPELYRCGVSLAGVSDMVTFLGSRPFYIDDESMRGRYEAIGDPRTERGRLENESSLFNLERIVAPLLLVHGAADEWVPVAQSRMLEKAMREKGKAVRSIEFPDEGHWIEKRENKVAYYGAVAAFLDEHMAGERER